MKSHIFALRYIEVGENMHFYIKAKKIVLILLFTLQIAFSIMEFSNFGDKKGQIQA